MMAQISNAMAQRQKQGFEAWLAYEQARRRQALANFKAQHGCDCLPWFNDVVLMRDYTGYVWRKSGIPPCGRRMMLTVKPN